MRVFARELATLLHVCESDGDERLARVASIMITTRAKEGGRRKKGSRMKATTRSSSRTTSFVGNFYECSAAGIRIAR